MPILDHTASAEHTNERLRSDLVIWLGTSRPDGRVHLVPVWFWGNGETLLILSQPDTQKVRNLRADPRVTIALDGTRDGKDVVILEGVATLLDTPSNALDLDGYLGKYAALLTEMEWDAAEMIRDYSQAIDVRVTRFVSW